MRDHASKLESSLTCHNKKTHLKMYPGYVSIFIIGQSIACPFFMKKDFCNSLNC